MKRMFPMILLFALLLCVPVRADELTLDAPSALLMEKQTGMVLFAKDEHTPREPASVTKVMTLLLTMEAIDSGALSYDDTVTGSAHAASMGGSPDLAQRGRADARRRPHQGRVRRLRQRRGRRARRATWQAARKRLSRA